MAIENYDGKAVMKMLMNIFAVILSIFLQLELQAQPQYMFEITQVNDPSPGMLKFDWVMKPEFAVVDNYGYFVSEKETSGSGLYYFRLQNGNIAQLADDRYYIYNSKMNLIDSVLNKTSHIIDFHDFASLSNGRYLMLLTENVITDMSQLVEGGDSEAIIINNIIIETDRTGTVYWEWNALDHLEITDATSSVDLKQKTIDFAHINSMYEDPNGNILISIRHFDEIILVRKSDGEIIWTIGGQESNNNEYTFTNDFASGFEGFSHQHTVQLLPNGNILMFDNGNLKPLPISRAVEYSVNHSSKTITKVWEYTSSPPYYSSSMGSAYRLANGNTLISWSRGMITEVKPNNEIALELISNTNFPIYRAYKFDYGANYGESNINSVGTYQFSGNNGYLGASLYLNSVNGNTKAYMNRYDYAPHTGNFDDTLFTELLPIRWVLQPETRQVSIAGTFKIDASVFGNSIEREKITLYKRDYESKGTFTKLVTSYNASSNEITAPFSGWGEFVATVADLSKPVLIFPQKDLSVFNDTKLKWEHVHGATNYQVRVSKNENLTQATIDDFIGNQTEYKCSGLSFDTKYYWAVRAINNKDTSDWSEVFFFNTTVSTPELISPVHESFGFRKKDTIRWTESEGADSYHLQVNYSNNFIHPIINEKNLKNTYFLLNGLSNDTKHFWRIRAMKGADTSKWSEIYTFHSVVSNPIPSTPKDSAINVDLNQQFSWSYVPDVNKYWFQIADNPSFKTPIVDYDNVGSTEIKAEHLDYGKTYFWRVKSLRVQDSSDWSEVMTFSTLLPPVVLNYPEMNATDIHVEVNLSWSKLDKDILYHLQLSEFNDFSTNLVDVKEINNNYMHIPELKPQTKYYWRVLAYRGEVNSVWSSVGIFTTDEGYDILAPKQISPENASQTLNDVNFLWSQRAKAVSYSLQVAKDPEFLNITHDVKNIDVPQYKIIGFDDNMYYFWRVKSHSLFDSSSWSEVWRFHVINKGQTISLLLPENEALQTPLKGTLEWESISNIEYYNLEISEDNDFDSPIISNDIININRYDYNFDTKNKTYFWRVRYVKEEYVSDWSEVWSFTTMTETVLNTPEIVSSINGKTEVPVEGEIIWSEVDMATDYQVSLSNRQNFSSIFYKQSGIVGTKLNYTNLDYGALYYARVAASNSNSKSQWSDRISFTTELEKPAIVFPPDGAEKVPSKGVITWALSNDIYFYQIQIAIDKNFNSIIIDMDNFDHLIYNYSLGEDAEYFCRVRTYNDTNSSAWSNTVKFKTDGPTSVDVMTEQLLVYPNPSSNFLYINLSGVRSVNEIEIFNLTGSVLSKTSVNDTVMKIDISNLSEGVYFVKVGNIIKPLIKTD